MDVVPLEKVSEDEDDDNSFDHRDDHEQIAGFFSPNRVHKLTMESMVTALATCEIARLPGDLLLALLARTGPLDACRAAVVSRNFRTAADADAIWSSFLPNDLPPLADGELPADPQLTKKQLFMRLFRLRRTRPTRRRSHGETPQYWRWIPLTNCRFSEGAQLLEVSWLDIRGKIHCNMLSQNTTYAACLVFMMSDESFGMEVDEARQVAKVGIGATKSTRWVCLGYGVQHYPQTRAEGSRDLKGEFKNEEGEGLVYVHYPQTRADGWMEMELGEFKNEEGDDGEVSISLEDMWVNSWKAGH